MVVRNGQIILRVVETGRYAITVTTALEKVQKIVTGQEVTVRIDAFPDRTYRGRIAGARVLPGSKQPRMGAFSVRVDDPSGAIKPGMTAVVECELSEGE
jgi:multidrug efflux pump subunit AcrA (membrane-fusion protein)